MKRISFYVASILLTTASLTGCSLESEQYDKVDSNHFPETAKNVEQLVTNCYDIFGATGYSDRLFSSGGGVWVMNSMMSDDGFVERVDEKWLCMMYPRWAPASANKGDVNNSWSFMNKLSRMELSILRIQATDIDEKLKARYIGELQCGQGLLAFMLYDLYGPLIIADAEVLNDPEAMIRLPRKTETEMDEYITGKLNDAAKALEAWETGTGDDGKVRGKMDYGRFTSGLCHMVLMKYYMQTRQWAKAVTEGRAIQNNTTYKYGLNETVVPGMNKFSSIFSGKNEENREIIYAVPNLSGQKEMKWPAYVLTGNDAHIQGCWRMWSVPWSFYDKYADDDLRKAVLQTSYVGQDGFTYTRENPNPGQKSNIWDTLDNGCILNKYPMAEASAPEQCDIDYIVYRYADAITLLAEALVKSGQADPTAEPLTLLNEVHTRAGLTAYTAADVSSKAKFLQLLLDERAKELNWEGCRRQDLIRNDIFNSTLYTKSVAAGQNTNISSEDPAKPEDGSTKYYDENDKRYWYYRLPLPESVIAESLGAVTQNPY
jgi:hypothetical protein